MKFIFMMLFMIPLSLFLNFWLNFSLYMLLFLMFVFVGSYDNMYVSLSDGLGADLLSYSMVLLTIWICGLMILASSKIYFYKNYSWFFLLLMLGLMITLFFSFVSMNLFMFYLFFEASLIPTLMLILGWGYQPERIQAGLYLLFYTMLASLPMMVSIFYSYKISFSLDYFLLPSLGSPYIFMMMNLVFLVKMPMYFVHLWLPKAHVEAPISGSMILAGIMLKLGGYGMMRVMKMFMGMMKIIGPLLMVVALLGALIMSLVCLIQSDMKSLIAYSSVSHMGLVLGGIMTFSNWGMVGSLMMMIAHGLCSSGMFCLANISYERLYSRSLFVNKGLMNILPSCSLWWFLLSSSNMAAPPSLNLMGEIFLINSMVGWSSWSMLALGLVSFFGAGYTLYLYSYSQHGQNFSGLFSFTFISIREYLLLLLHWLPLNLFFMKADLMVWI
uniref:NADH-ubiquinone oxidoreductase chain 4 n=1 Tax=Euspilotus scissus TaxID=694456 RepID=D8WKP5_9COLE|nr:NADH dehydrogenase subunit 4 [Euspilotus scissus]ACZ58578.1 NADH dehydrogenase subunit 4 [Euspilotus scissus]